ncbi:hypothetical protein HK100_009213, partial [Physocladia obscura]
MMVTKHLLALLPAAAATICQTYPDTFPLALTGGSYQLSSVFYNGNNYTTFFDTCFQTDLLHVPVGYLPQPPKYTYGSLSFTSNNVPQNCTATGNTLQDRIDSFRFAFNRTPSFRLSEASCVSFEVAVEYPSTTKYPQMTLLLSFGMLGEPLPYGYIEPGSYNFTDSTCEPSMAAFTPSVLPFSKCLQVFSVTDGQTFSFSQNASSVCGNDDFKDRVAVYFNSSITVSPTYLAPASLEIWAGPQQSGGG